MMGYAELNRQFSTLNDDGKGYPVGADDSDINELADELGELVHRSAGSHEIAVYRQDGSLHLVGDANGPWCVTIDA